MGISKPSQSWAKHQKDMAVLYSDDRLAIIQNSLTTSTFLCHVKLSYNFLPFFIFNML